MTAPTTEEPRTPGGPCWRLQRCCRRLLVCATAACKNPSFCILSAGTPPCIVFTATSRAQGGPGSRGLERGRHDRTYRNRREFGVGLGNSHRQADRAPSSTSSRWSHRQHCRRGHERRRQDRAYKLLGQDGAAVGDGNRQTDRPPAESSTPSRGGGFEQRRQNCIDRKPRQHGELWETETGKPIGSPLKHDYAVKAVAISADGKTALTTDSNLVRLWETATGKPIGSPLKQKVVVVAISPDGKFALSAGWNDTTARLWETTTGKPIGSPLHHQGVITSLAISANGKTALTGSEDRTARLWETAAGKPIGPPLQHQHKVTAVAISADGSTALTGGWDMTARVWDTAIGRPTGPRLEHKGVAAVAIAAGGKTALTGGLDKAARLWDAKTGKMLGPPLQHPSDVKGVAIERGWQSGPDNSLQGRPSVGRHDRQANRTSAATS